MCEFVSWIEYEGKSYFLINGDLETKEGQKLLASDVKDDICGYGAIESYYPELKGKGTHKECTDFSTPDNFPLAIVEALKAGKMSRIGVVLDILNEGGRIEYEKIQQQAYAEYEKIQIPAYAEYEKIEQQAYAKIVSQKKYRTDNWK
jgi:hypothetical protein